MEIVPPDPRYEVFLSLVYRALPAENIQAGWWYRVEATEREMNMLSHGDEGRVDGNHWRITGRNPEKNCIFLSASQEVCMGEIAFRFRPADPLDEIREELCKWEETFRQHPREVSINFFRSTARSFFDHLTSNDLVCSYIYETEFIKNWYREGCCGSGLLIYEPHHVE